VGLVIALLATSALAGQEIQSRSLRISILFIGNSYTYYNDLPGTLRSMAAAGQDTLDVRVASVVEGGASLRAHWNQRTIELIRRGAWDYVVLQEQSLAPLEARDQFLTYGKRFANEIRASNAKAVLYLTWSRQQRPADQERLNQAYADLARETDAMIVPVGPVWQEFRYIEGVPNLYAEDGSHPSTVGSFVAVSTFYRMLFGESPPDRSGLAYGLEPRTVRLIRQGIEDAVVLFVAR
jgi:hypothetical protein